MCFFFKQKTAYEMRISDWSSDVCSSDLKHWRRIAAKYGLDPGDDPVPQPIVDALNRIELEALREAIWEIPFRQSAGLDRRLKATRKAIVDALKDAWPAVLRRVNVRLPLLILDEAHHVKTDRKSVGKGKGVSVSVDPGGTD